MDDLVWFLPTVMFFKKDKTKLFLWQRQYLKSKTTTFKNFFNFKVATVFHFKKIFLSLISSQGEVMGRGNLENKYRDKTSNIVYQLFIVNYCYVSFIENKYYSDEKYCLWLISVYCVSQPQYATKIVLESCVKECIIRPSTRPLCMSSCLVFWKRNK